LPLALAKIKKKHVPKPVRIINVAFNDVNRNLVVLQDEAILKTKVLGPLKVIELQTENPKTLALLKALELLERPIYVT